MSSALQFDVLVIGGGHAGAEAAWAASRLGADTALVTFDLGAIGRMSCNPAIGGIGKGQMVREIDALGGLMGRVADESGIQFRMLNRGKGPAVWSPRCQSDRAQYEAAVQRHLQSCPKLRLIAGSVERVEASPGRNGARWRVRGVRLQDGTELTASTVVVTSGTFLRALMHCGESQTPGGRIGEAAAAGLSRSLAQLGLHLGRLKTGTPPRIAARSVDFARLEAQPGDPDPAPFSHLTGRITRPQVDCWIAYTNPAIHGLIRENLHRAPMYSGQIQSRGPRYCPSIEDKVVRFADKPRHQLFLEPEGLDSDRIYVNGISTSLPRDVQARIVAGIEGLERAEVVQWGYAVEYDFVPPEQIDDTLMTRAVEGLFLAGQINGTSGYEEAAGQGLMAGINAARYAAGRAGVTLRRDQAYVGVMIDDLVTLGVTEPYRMFTSRAEHRILLRYDNADERLTPLGREIGLVDDARWERFQAIATRRAALASLLDSRKHEGRTLADWVRSGRDIRGVAESIPELATLARERDVWDPPVIRIRYSGYIQKEERNILRMRELEQTEIPRGFDFSQIPHLRREALQRWQVTQPSTVGQASRLSGVHPSDITALVLRLAATARI